MRHLPIHRTALVADPDCVSILSNRRGLRAMLLLLLVALTAGPGWGAPSFDPFADATAEGGTSYAIGSNLVGQNNSTLFAPWYLRGGNFPGTQPTIVAGNLGYPGLPPASGNSVAFAPANSMSACIDLDVVQGHGETVYYSFLLQITNLAAVPTSPANNPIAAFIDDPRTSLSPNQIARLGSRLLTKRVGDGYVLGISKSALPEDFVYESDAAAHSTAEVLLVVASYQWVPDVQTNVNLWINPPAASLGSNQPPEVTLVAVSGNTALNSSSARAFAIMCQFDNAPGGIIDEVRVSVNDWAYVTGGDPAILTQPTSQTLAEGSTAHFSVVARGTPTLTYQWYKSGTTALSDSGNISGATTAELSISSISSADAGDYSVTVMNGLGSTVTSRKAHLALSDPQITGQPQSRTNNFGTRATFEVTASGTAPLTYQWHKQPGGDLIDGGNILGSHSNVLAISGLTLADAGTYSVTVSNALGTVAESAAASLTVLDPYFATQPSPVTSLIGATATFHVVVAGSGAPAFSYQWRKDGNPIFDAGNYSGTTTDTLSISGVSSGDQGNYSVEVTGASSLISSDAALVVISPVIITMPPNPRTVAPGSRAVFAVGVTGTPPLSYQWQVYGSNISGATSFAYIVTNAQAREPVTYSIIVSNAASAQTNTVTLKVDPNLHLYRTNLLVVAAGDGAQTQTLNGNSVFLHQFKPDGTYLNTVNLPDDGRSALVVLGLDNINGINTGSTTGTSLTRSLDGRFLVIAGYNTNLNYGASLVNAPAAAVPRGIGLIDSYAQFTLPVASTDAAENATFWRAAVTDGTNNFWGVSGKSGTYYFGFDAPPAFIQTTFLNNRSMGLFNGNIYCAGAVSGSTGLLKISGMPTTTNTPTVLFAGSSGTYDMAVRPDGNLIYVADQRSVQNGGGVQRWEFDGANWNLSYTLTAGFGGLGPRYLTADFSGANPTIYAMCNDQSLDNNRLVMVQDTGAQSAATTLAYAGVNQTFRGIAFGPVERPVLLRPVLSYERQGDNLILSWPGEFKLQSAPEVLGTYGDVSGAPSPYTNNLTATNRVFFRLHN